MKPWIAITGASSGIGRAATLRFVKSGYGVFALARRAERLNDLVAETDDSAVVPITVDVREEDQVDAAAEQIRQRCSRLAGLVNSAGLSLGLTDFPNARPQHWMTMIDTNVKGLLLCTRAFLPELLPDGHIINVGSIAGEYPYFGGNVYAATKSFVRQLSLNLRVDLQNTQVRTTCVAPGMTETEFALVRFDGDTERAKAFYRDLRPLDPEDVADAIWWAFSTPPHVNVNYIELMPVEQPFGLSFARAVTSGVAS